MVQVLPRGPSLGQVLGKSVGTGLGSGLENLLASKQQQAAVMQQLIQDQQRKVAQQQGLKSLGFEEDQLENILSLDPSIQKEIIKQKLVEPQQRQFAESLSAILGSPESTTPDAVETGKLSADQAAKLAQLQLQKQQTATKERTTAFKETQKLRQEVLQKKQSADENIKRLDRMEDLLGTGKLTNPIYKGLLEKAGIDIPALMNPESQEFEKLSFDLTAGMAKDFGNRINIAEFKTFLRRVPSLSQSDEGKKRVIENFKNISIMPNIMRHKAMQEVLRENQGVPPLDLAEQIEEKVGPQLSQLAEKVNMDLQIGRNLQENVIEEGMVTVVAPNGKRGKIPQEKLEEALKAGFKQL